ncbi:hypothetical protein [Nocardia sp. NPDC005978]
MSRSQVSARIAEQAGVSVSTASCFAATRDRLPANLFRYRRND